jgi:hypothetical protein
MIPLNMAGFPKSWGRRRVKSSKLMMVKRSTKIRQRVLETGVGARHEMQVTDGGRTEYFDVTIEPVFDSTGAVIRVTGAAMNVSALREATKALLEAKKKLAEEKLYLEQEIDTELGSGKSSGEARSCNPSWNVWGWWRQRMPPCRCWAKREREKSWWRGQSSG